jgi:hypothetical protein
MDVSSKRLHRFLHRMFTAAILLIFPSSPSIFAEAPSNTEHQLSHAEKVQVIQAAWQDVNDLFYDPGFRGVNWANVLSEYIRRVD